MDRDLVIRFHALKAPTVKVKVVPWHPKNNMRSDRPYDLLFHLAHCGPWIYSYKAMGVTEVKTKGSQAAREGSVGNLYCTIKCL